MTTGGGDARDDRAGNQRPERINVGSNDDSVTRIQLAARWAEAFGEGGDTLGQTLRRFKAAYDYLDAVIHGVEPPELDHEVVGGPMTAAPSRSEAQVETPPSTEQRTW
jgi:hypothetical protein